MDSYDPRIARADELNPHLDLSWDLLQKWNVISDSYRSKYHSRWDLVRDNEEKVRSLIAVLSTS